MSDEKRREPVPLAIEFSSPPEQLFAATSAHIVDRGTCFALVYAQEDGQDQPARAVVVILSATGLRHFSDRAEEVLRKAPELADLRDPAAFPPRPTRWATGLVVGSNAVFNARAGDLITTDFYLVAPRVIFAASQAARAGSEPPSSPVTLKAEPVITCALDIWQFRRLAREAETIARTRVAELGGESLLLDRKPNA